MNKKQRQVLIELSRKGYIGNWYNSFGNYKVKVYRQEGNDDYITMNFKGNELNIDPTFTNVGWNSPERDEKLKEYQEAIDIYESIIGPKAYR
ncbi:MAG: hypothetical protein ACO1OT_08885 [Heyndrickxia sp.]